MADTTKKRIKHFLILLLVIAASILTIKLFPWFTSLVKDASARNALKEYVAALGWKGYFYMLGLQVLQVIIAVLPGEPVELLAGMIFGTFGGLLICMLGLLIGSSLVFFTIRKLGSGFAMKHMNHEHKGLLAFLNDSKKLELLTFILFFIPGTPKDMLTYIAPLTKIRPLHFLVIATLARIPSVITSTYAGQAFIDGELWKTVAMFIFMGIIGIAGVLVNNSIMDKKEINLQKESEPKNMNNQKESILQAINEHGALPIARFELRNSKDDGIASTALNNVWLCTAADSMELVKARGAAIAELIEQGAISESFELSGANDETYKIYEESDIFALLCQTVEEGRGRANFLFDTAYIAHGELTKKA